MSQFYTDYDKAKEAAQEMADWCDVQVRLRVVKEFCVKGYRFNLVPRTASQHGRDLVGELINPRRDAVTLEDKEIIG